MPNNTELGVNQSEKTLTGYRAQCLNIEPHYNYIKTLEQSGEEDSGGEMELICDSFFGDDGFKVRVTLNDMDRGNNL